MTAGTSRWERWARPRVLIAVVVVVLLTTVGLIVLYSLLLGRMSKQVEEAQSRSANLSNADREVLILQQAVTHLGPDGDPDDVELHRAVATRQIVVSIVSFEPDDPAGPRAAGRPGPAGGVPLGPARREPWTRRRPAPRGDGSDRAVRGAGQRPAQRSRRSTSTP